MATSSNPRVLVIANPTSGGGATARRLPDIERALRRHGLPYQLSCTTRPGHASELARGARARGVDVVAAVGGDGTLNEIVQAWIDADGRPVEAPELALVPSGSGGDFRKTIGLSHSIDEAVARIRWARPRAIDLGLLDMQDHEGRAIKRAFLNIASFGVGGLADQIVNRAPKWIGGKPVFFAGTFLAMLQYKNQPVRVRIDGAPFYEGPIFNVAIANGRYFGGGMKIAPHAEPGDGRFEVVAIGDLGKTEILALTNKIYDGSHLAETGISVGSGKVVEAEPIHPWTSVLLDVDGEAPGKLPVRATLLPGAISFRA
jgi:YegS/Rv2252/BmrU family lipid kinase